MILGKLTIEVNEQKQLQKVNFYIDGDLVYTDTESPYEWLWNKPSFGKHVIRIEGLPNE